MKENSDVNDSLSGGVRRTRSQNAPDWTITESLILVNVIAAVEADCTTTLSSHQQWNIIAENCAALDVTRNMGQCRRKWNSIFSEYQKIKGWESKHAKGSYWSLKTQRVKKLGLPPNFDPELFEAIDAVVRAREERGEVEPESDPEAGNEVLDVTVEIGSIRKRQRSKSERYRAKKPKKCLTVESSENLSEDEHVPKESHEEEPENQYSEVEYLKDFIQQKAKMKYKAERQSKSHLEASVKKSLVEDQVTEMPKPSSAEKIKSSREENEEIMTLKLQDLAVKIVAIGNDTADYQSAGSQNVEDCHTEFTRRQGDKLIESMGNFANTLKELCDLLQECK